MLNTAEEIVQKKAALKNLILESFSANGVTDMDVQVTVRANGLTKVYIRPILRKTPFEETAAEIGSV